MSINMNFTIEADTDRRLIREKIYGIWKENTAKLYHDDFVLEAQPLIKGNWAKLIDLRNWRSSYPEVIAIVGEHLRWCRENGMVMAANVIDNPTTLGQLKRMFAIGGTEEMSMIFQTVDGADKYLGKSGF